MDRIRRAILKAVAGTAALVATSILATGRAAAAWNKPAFESKALADAVKGIGAANMIDSKDITITAPDIAENGAVVPISIGSKIPNTESISILAEKNPFPLAATFDIASGSEAYVSTRVKLGQTSNVRAVVKADGKFYTATKEVKVTVGGCG